MIDRMMTDRSDDVWSVWRWKPLPYRTPRCRTGYLVLDRSSFRGLLQMVYCSLFLVLCSSSKQSLSSQYDMTKFIFRSLPEQNNCFRWFSLNVHWSSFCRFLRNEPGLKEFKYFPCQKSFVGMDYFISITKLAYSSRVQC